MMAWHIFKKDLRLLWPLALAGAAGQLLLALLVFHTQHAGSGAAYEAIAALLTLGLIVTMSLTIVLAIQFEAPSSLNQDWLVRPVRPRDLLAAKLLFIALTIQGPMALCGTLRGLAEGLPLGATLGAVALSACAIAVIFTLPLTAIAALTKSVTEAIVAALAVLFIILLIRVVLPAPVTADTGIAWVWHSASCTLLLCLTAGVLLLQYLKRDTRRARWLALAAVVICMLVRALPWSPAFALQQAVEPAAEVRAGPAIEFGSTAQTTPAPIAGELFSADQTPSGAHSDTHGTTLLLPLRIVSLPPGSILHVDRMIFRLVAADGSTVYHGSGTGFDVAAQRSLHDPSAVRQRLSIPAHTWARYQDRPLRLDAHYWFTVLRGRRVATLPAVDADALLPAVGHCSSAVNADGTALDVRCFQAGAVPACTSAALEHPGSLQKNAEVFACTMDYVPSGLGFSADPIDHLHVQLPFRAATDAPPYAVDANKLPTARVLVTVYEASGHFSRQVQLPAVRLKDLMPAP